MFAKLLVIVFCFVALSQQSDFKTLVEKLQDDLKAIQDVASKMTVKSSKDEMRNDLDTLSERFHDKDNDEDDVINVRPDANGMITENMVNKAHGYDGSDIMQPKTHSSDTKSKDAEKASTKRGFPEDVTLWPKVNNQIVVPYEFDQTTLSTQEIAIIEDQIDFINCNIRCGTTYKHLRPKKDGDTHWIRIIKDNGCYSYIGDVRKYISPQLVSLGDGCIHAGDGRGIAQHELLHALGMDHEQSRSDRNSFVTIFFDRIIPGFRNQYNRLPVMLEGSRKSPYDYRSIMHYGQSDFSIVKDDIVIKAKDKAFQKFLGNRGDMTQTDIDELNSVYGCPPSITKPHTTKPPTTKPPTTKPPTTKPPTTKPPTTKPPTTKPPTTRPPKTSKLIFKCFGNPSTCEDKLWINLSPKENGWTVSNNQYHVTNFDSPARLSLGILRKHLQANGVCLQGGQNLLETFCLSVKYNRTSIRSPSLLVRAGERFGRSKPGRIGINELRDTISMRCKRELSIGFVSRMGERRQKFKYRKESLTIQEISLYSGPCH